MKRIKEFITGVPKAIWNFVKEYYSIFIVSFLCLFTVEILNHPTEGIWDVLLWYHTHTRAMLMNYVIYLDINFIFYVIINRLNIANILFFGAMNALGIVNYNKLILKGENLVLWDMFQAVDAAKAVTETKLEINWQIVFVVLMILLVALWQILGHRRRKKGSFRLRAILAAVVLLSGITIGVLFNDEMLNRIYLTNYDWNYDENYKENGFIFCYLMNLKNAVVSKPEDTSEEYIMDIAEAIDQMDVDGVACEDDVKNPNIIVVMCESFSDITVANEGLSFEEDIMPNIHSLNENVIRGNLLTSIFGGGTANSEFEFLTGNSCAFLPSGSVAYNSYVDEDTNSIVKVLKDEGYSAIAIHPYDREFYHRDQIYSYFGFDDFITEESFPEDAEIKKGYISDNEVYKMIISQYESKEEGKPLFAFTVTMENHTPYVDESNGVVGVDYDSSVYDSSKITQVGVHAKGVEDGDQLLGDLVEYFSSCDEPTLIVFFGDHHPYISNTVNLNSDTLDDVNKYKTQYVIWANYDIETNTDYVLDSSCLSAMALSAANIELPDYLKYNLYGASLIEGYNAYFVLDRDGDYYTYHDEMSKKITQFLEYKEAIQYDNMFGKKYSTDLMWSTDK